MATGERRALLDELDDLRREGGLTDGQHARLRARLAAAGATPAGASARAPASTARLGAPAVARPPRGAFAPHALQVVGGIFVGASLLALLLGLSVPDAARSLAALALAAAALVAARAAEEAEQPRPGLADAALAACVTLLLGAPFYPGSHAAAGAVAAVLAAALVHLRDGRGAAVLGATVAFVLGAYQASGVDLFHARNTFEPWLFGLALLAYLRLLLAARGTSWTSVSLGALVPPLCVALLPVMDALRVEDAGVVALAEAALLALLFALGVGLEERGLALAGGAGLAVVSIVLAFVLGGALVAVAALAGLGAVLVAWSDDLVRWLRGAPAPAVAFVTTRAR